MRKLKNWLEAYMRYTSIGNAPDMFYEWSGLWLLSAALGRKAWIDFGNHITYPNLFVLLVGNPGTFKSATCDTARDMIMEVPDIHMGPDDTSIEALLKSIGELDDVFHYGDTEIPHKSMASIVPEAGSLLGDKDTSLCRKLCRLYDCAKIYDKRTKTQGNDLVTNYFFTLFAGTTKDDLVDCLPTSAIGSGLSSRLIILCQEPDPTKRRPPGSGGVKNEKLEHLLIRDLIEINETLRGPFIQSPEAIEYYKSWYAQEPNHRIMDDKNFEYYYNRKVNKFTYQVALLLSAGRGNSRVIEIGDIKKSIQLFAEAEPTMSEALGGIGDNSLAKIINEIKLLFVKTRKKKLSLKFIGTETWQLASDWDLSRAIKQMKTIGLVDIEKVGKDEVFVIWKKK